jgi:hypothetical protein
VIQDNRIEGLAGERKRSRVTTNEPIETVPGPQSNIATNGDGG